MNSWQRAMAASTLSTPTASVRAAMNRSGSWGGAGLGEHLLDRNDLLARQVAATIGEYLIADEKARHPGRLESAHHLSHIVDAAEPGVGININR
jgi:hypothetical protein